MSGDNTNERAQQINELFRTQRSQEAWQEYVEAVQSDNDSSPANVQTNTLTELLVDQGRLPDMILRAADDGRFKDDTGVPLEQLTLENLSALSTSTDPVAQQLALAMIEQFLALDTADGVADGTINLADFQARHLPGEFSPGLEEVFTYNGLTETISADGRVTTFGDQTTVEHVGDQYIYRDAHGNPTRIYENGVLVNYYHYDQNGLLDEYMDNGLVYRKYNAYYTSWDTTWYQFQAGATYPSNRDDVVDLHRTGYNDVLLTFEPNPTGDCLPIPHVTVYQNNTEMYSFTPSGSSVVAQFDPTATRDENNFTVTFPNAATSPRMESQTFVYENGQWTMGWIDTEQCHDAVPVNNFRTADGDIVFYRPGSNRFTTIHADGSVNVETIDNGERAIANDDGTRSSLHFENGYLISIDNFSSSNSEVPRVSMQFDADGQMTSALLADGTTLLFNAESNSYQQYSAEGNLIGTIQGELSGNSGVLQYRAPDAENFADVFNGDNARLVTENGHRIYRADGTVAEVYSGVTTGLVSGRQQILCDAEGNLSRIVLESNDGSQVDRYFALINGEWIETEVPNAAGDNYLTPLEGAEPLVGPILVDETTGAITLNYENRSEIFASDHYTRVYEEGTDTVYDDGTFETSENNEAGDINPVYTVSPPDDNLIVSVELPAATPETEAVGWTLDEESGVWNYQTVESDGFAENNVQVIGPADVVGDPFLNVTEGDPKFGAITFTRADGSTIQYDRFGNIIQTVSGGVTREFQYTNGSLSSVTPPGISLQVQQPPSYTITDELGNVFQGTFSISADGEYTQINAADGSSLTFKLNGDVEQHRADSTWSLSHPDGTREYHAHGIVIEYDTSSEIAQISFDSTYEVPDQVSAAHSADMEPVEESRLLDFLGSEAGARLRAIISTDDGYIAFAAVDEAFRLIGQTPPGFTPDEIVHLTRLHESFFNLNNQHPVIQLAQELQDMADAGYAAVDPAVMGASAGAASELIYSNPEKFLLADNSQVISRQSVEQTYNEMIAQGGSGYTPQEIEFITTLHNSFERLSADSPDGTLTLDQLAIDAGYPNWAELSAMYIDVHRSALTNSLGDPVAEIVTTVVNETQYALQVDYVNPAGASLVIGYRGVGSETALNQIAEPNGTTVSDITSLGDGNYSFTVNSPDGSTSQEHARIEIDPAAGTVRFDYGNGRVEVINADGTRTVCDGTGLPQRTIAINSLGHEHVTHVDYGNGRSASYSYNEAGDLIHAVLPNGLTIERTNGHSDFVLRPLNIALSTAQLDFSTTGELSFTIDGTSTNLIAATGEVAPLETTDGSVTSDGDGFITVHSTDNYYSSTVYDAVTGSVIELATTDGDSVTFDSSSGALTVRINGNLVTATGDTVEMEDGNVFVVRHVDGSFERYNNDGSIEIYSPATNTEITRDAEGNVIRVVNASNSADPIVREFTYSSPAGPNAQPIRIVQGTTAWEPDPNNPDVWLRFGTVNHQRILDMDNTQQSRPGPVVVVSEGPDAGLVTFGSTETQPYLRWMADGRTELHNADESVVETDARGQITKVTFPDGSTREFAYTHDDELGLVTSIQDTDGSVWTLEEGTTDHWLHAASSDPSAGPGNPPDAYFHIGFADSEGTLRIEHTTTYGVVDVFTTNGNMNGEVSDNLLFLPIEAPPPSEAPVLVEEVSVEEAPALVFQTSPECVDAETQLAYLSTLKPWEYEGLKNEYGGISVDSLRGYIELHENEDPNDPQSNPQMLAAAEYLLANFDAIQQSTGREDASFIRLADLQTYRDSLNNAAIDASNLTPVQKELLKQLNSGMSAYQVQPGDVPITIGMNSLIAQGFENPTQQQALMEARRIMRLNGWDEIGDPNGNTWTSLYVGQRLIMQRPETIAYYQQQILAGVNVDLHQLTYDAGVVAGDNSTAIGSPVVSADSSTWTSDSTLPSGITHLTNPNYPFNDETRLPSGFSVIKNVNTGRLELFSSDGTRLGFVDETYLQDGQFRPVVTGGTVTYTYLDTYTGVEVTVSIAGGVTTRTWTGDFAGRSETVYPNGLRDTVLVGGRKIITLPNGQEISQEPGQAAYLARTRLRGLPLLGLSNDGSISYQYANPDDASDILTVRIDGSGTQTISHSNAEQAAA